MTLAFPFIGSYLAWRVGHGSQVRVGEDAIMGLVRDIFLPDEIIHDLKVTRICTLNLIDILDETSLWSQGSRKEVDVGLDGNSA